MVEDLKVMQLDELYFGEDLGVKRLERYQATAPPQISRRSLYPTPAPMPSTSPTPPRFEPARPNQNEMCLFRIDPSRGPIDPPGAAPVLVSLEEDQVLTAMAEAENEARAKAISASVDAREKPQPVRPVSQESLQERRESLANGTRRVEIGR